MAISSRTPEGEPNRCPICDSDVCIEPSVPFGDAPCPNCGHLLWFLNLPSGTRYFKFDDVLPMRDRVLEIVARQLGVNKEKIRADMALAKALEMDSLDSVELVMELEDEFGFAGAE